MPGYIGVDLDGTLAHYDGRIDEVGEPIEPMLYRVKQWLAEGREVRIITARVSPEWSDLEYQTEIIRAWCLKHLDVELVVQCHKSGDMLQLYDDRAVGVMHNDGRLTADVHFELGCFLGRTDVEGYDTKHGIESDAYALVVDTEDHYPIRVEMVTGDPKDAFMVSTREARCLAASLLRAAEEAERQAWADQAEQVKV